MNYVCGFAYCEGDVLLIRKNRPEWQAGKMNGIGGKIEHAEGIRSAMAREFKEECGIDTDPLQWTTFYVERYRTGNMVYFMTTKLTREQFDSFRSMTDEQVFAVHSLHIGYKHPEKLIYNLPYILPMVHVFHHLNLLDQNLGH